MTVTEQLMWDGRLLTLSWSSAPVQPPRELVTQASGVCFTGDGKVVLVAGVDQCWALPGGHPEPGETIEQAFIREVKEEACAIVQHLAYLGARQVDDPGSTTEPPRYYQARFWARVQLERFEPKFETRHRMLVTPAEVLAALGWKTSRIGETLLEGALAAENHFVAMNERSTPA